MRQVFAYRANKILYNFIKSNNIIGTVILPSNICKDVVEVLQYAGLNLKFLDISQNTLCLDENQIKECINEVSVLLFVHTYGIERDFDNLFFELKEIKPSLIIIDDKCLCIPDLEMKTKTCSDLVLYSTGEKKQIDLGRGGIGYVTQKYKYEDIEINDSSCLTNEYWQFDRKLFEQKKQEVISHKCILNTIYFDKLSNINQLPKEFQNWRFNILTDKKEQILKALFAEGLFASSHYKTHVLATNADKIYNNVINLFNDQYYTVEQAIKTCEIINKILNI